MTVFLCQPSQQLKYTGSGIYKASDKHCHSYIHPTSVSERKNVAWIKNGNNCLSQLCLESLPLPHSTVIQQTKTQMRACAWKSWVTWEAFQNCCNCLNFSVKASAGCLKPPSIIKNHKLHGSTTSITAFPAEQRLKQPHRRYSWENVQAHLALL